jgi:chromosome segregation ATPase
MRPRSATATASSSWPGTGRISWAAAILAVEGLWRRPPTELAAALRAAFRRLPHAVELASAVDLLVAQTQTIADFARLRPELRARLTDLATRLGAPAAGTLVEIVERLAGAATALADSRAAAVSALQQQQQSHAEAVAALQQQLQSRVNTIEVLQQELQVRADEQAARERKIAELQQEVVRRSAEFDRVREQFSVAVRDVSGLAGQRDSANVRIAELEQSLANATERFKRATTEMDAVRSGHEGLRYEHGSLQEQYVELASRVHELVLTLRDRERWIALLLAEVQRRRLRRRPLTDHEREFLARLGSVGRP